MLKAHLALGVRKGCLADVDAGEALREIGGMVRERLVGDMPAARRDPDDLLEDLTDVRSHVDAVRVHPQDEREQQP